VVDFIGNTTAIFAVINGNSWVDGHSMETKQIRESLQDAIAQFEIIDCHEHLPPESVRLDMSVDVFTLFSHYTRLDLWNAGMSQEQWNSLFDPDIPLDQRWDMFEPFWNEVRWTSYVKSALLTAKHFYGFDDINRQTYQLLSEAIRRANKPGIYERVLKDACNIRTAITQCGRTDTGTPLLTPVMVITHSPTWQGYQDLFGDGGPIDTLDDLVDASQRHLARVKSEGAVGMKIMSWPYQEPDREAALTAFREIQGGETLPCPTNPLFDYLIDRMISFASEMDLVVCVHAGYWGDFRELDPLHMIPLITRHPKARFDIYHAGYPWVRETLMLGKGFPNVWLNFCWTHIISQRFAVAAFDEAIDLLPANKLMAFGGDYQKPVEKVIGHLMMAREDVSEVLARRISNGRMTESQALALAKKWFWDNPVALYRLSV
jgi:uncharacterized protein